MMISLLRPVSCGASLYLSTWASAACTPKLLGSNVCELKHKIRDSAGNFENFFFRNAPKSSKITFIGSCDSRRLIRKKVMGFLRIRPPGDLSPPCGVGFY